MKQHIFGGPSVRYADCMMFNRPGECRFVVASNRIHTTPFRWKRAKPASLMP